jgi:hypothetical protein
VVEPSEYSMYYFPQVLERLRGHAEGVVREYCDMQPDMTL